MTTEVYEENGKVVLRVHDNEVLLSRQVANDLCYKLGSVLQDMSWRQEVRDDRVEFTDVDDFTMTTTLYNEPPMIIGGNPEDWELFTEVKDSTWLGNELSVIFVDEADQQFCEMLDDVIESGVESVQPLPVGVMSRVDALIKKAEENERKEEK